jgi:hypothetical protein
MNNGDIEHPSQMQAVKVCSMIHKVLADDMFVIMWVGMPAGCSQTGGYRGLYS